MSQFLAEDESTITPIDSPDEALGPRNGQDEKLPALPLSDFEFTLDQTTTARLKPPLFDHRLLTNAVSTNTLVDDVAVQHDFKFKFSPTTKMQPSRQSTLDEAVTHQVSESRSAASIPYRVLAETIISTVCSTLDLSTEHAAFLTKDSKATDKVSQMVQDFVFTNLLLQTSHQQPKFSFATGTLRNDKTTSDYYSQILPFDLVERAQKSFLLVQRGSFPTCMAIKPDGSSCNGRSKLSDSALDALIQELTQIPRPLDFCRVIKVLLMIADLIFCAASHLKKKRLAIRELYKYFCGSATSSDRRAELKCLVTWIQALIGRHNREGNNREAESDLQEISETNISPGTTLHHTSRGTHAPDLKPKLRHSTILTDLSVSHVFRFEYAPDFERAGFKEEECNFAPSTTHMTYQPYSWPVKQRALDTDQLVDYVLNRKLPKNDLKRRGHIYVYGHAEGIGYVKIGQSRVVKKRLGQWEKQCTYLIHEHRDLLEEIDRYALHAQRLEDLVHATFKDSRYKVSACEHCGSEHKEWFRVSAKQAQEAVKKWTLWMQTLPYDEHGYLKPEAAPRPEIDQHETNSIPPTKSDRRSSSQRMRKTVSKSRPSSVHPMKTRSHNHLS